MTPIRIEYLEDSHDCETCGYSYAEGARVYFAGVLAFELTPVAHCFGGDNYSQDEVFRQILEKLGYSLETTYA